MNYDPNIHNRYFPPDILHEHRFLCNEAIHELKTPSKEDLRLAIEIVENVFETLYGIPKKGMKLKKNRK